MGLREDAVSAYTARRDAIQAAAASRTPSKGTNVRTARESLAQEGEAYIASWVNEVGFITPVSGRKIRHVTEPGDPRPYVEIDFRVDGIAFTCGLDYNSTVAGSAWTWSVRLSGTYVDLHSLADLGEMLLQYHSTTFSRRVRPPRPEWIN
jgi:hypothetical protein